MHGTPLAVEADALAVSGGRDDDTRDFHTLFCLLYLPVGVSMLSHHCPMALSAEAGVTAISLEEMVKSNFRVSVGFFIVYFLQAALILTFLMIFFFGHLKIDYWSKLCDIGWSIFAVMGLF